MSGAPVQQRSIELGSVMVDGEQPLTIIEPSRWWTALHLKEIWDYRELLLFLTWRDIKVRYRQTVIGAAWAIIQPVFSMVVFSILFGRLARFPSDGIPYLPQE
jgi:lipopolysaccharide transport system permease protein